MKKPFITVVNAVTRLLFLNITSSQKKEDSQ
jgi:hypothetical protein